MCKEECSKQKARHSQSPEEEERMVLPENEKQASVSGARETMWTLVQIRLNV